MTRHAFSQGTVLVVSTLAALVVAGSARAQSTTLYTEYVKTITTAQNLEPYGSDMFGDQINLYTGSTEFAVTDVSLKGNSTLPVSIGRRYQVQDKLGFYTGGGRPTTNQQFGNWSLDVPYLTGTFAKSTGWVSRIAPNGSQRCTIPSTNPGLAAPPVTSDIQTGSTWFAAGEYWHGNSLHMPGGGDQEMLLVHAGNPQKPTAGGPYYWVTKDQWFFSCLSTTANGVSGEAFLARAPDGTTYKFDWFVSWTEKRIEKPHSMPSLDPPVSLRAAADGSFKVKSIEAEDSKAAAIPPITPMAMASAFLTRSEVHIYPTEVQDRFGNKVVYTFDPVNKDRLTRIEGFTPAGVSDGRRIDLTYDASGHISTLTSGTQVWTYTYAGSELTTVTLPDQSKWQYALGGLDSVHISAELIEPAGCWGASMDPGQSTYAGTIVHPSGATGSFTVRPTERSRSNTPTDSSNCFLVSYWNGVGYTTSAYAYHPPRYAAVSLQSKTISGAGMTTQQWHYAYSAPVDCSGGGTCPGTSTTEVTGPTHWERHTFSNRFQDAEGMPEKVQTGGSAASILSTKQSAYLTNATGQAFVARIGISPFARGDHSSEKFAPVYSQTTTQQGRLFSWQVPTGCGTGYCFDVFARPKTVIKSSSPSP